MTIFTPFLLLLLLLTKLDFNNAGPVKTAIFDQGDHNNNGDGYRLLGDDTTPPSPTVVNQQINEQLYASLLGGQSVPYCQSMRGLSPGQMRLCQSYPQLMPYVRLGYQVAVQECMRQMSHRKWNCSIAVTGPPEMTYDLANLENIQFYESNPLEHGNLQKRHSGDGSLATALSTDVIGGTRESAFVNALASSAISYAIARACRENSGLAACGCSTSPRPSDLQRTWLWGGCGDNIEFGTQFAQLFTDIKEKERNYPRHSKQLAKALMNMHNNEAGRKAVESRVKVYCKCHGVSASCNLKTCWHQLSDFRLIGNDVRERYDAAQEVSFNKKGTKLNRQSIESTRSRRFVRATYGKEDLIFFENSPDFCAPKNGFDYGTKGRACLKGVSGPESCDSLCCGRPTRTVVKTREQRCNCKFQWCCRIDCEVCRSSEIVHVCD